jgi:FO synthase
MPDAELDDLAATIAVARLVLGPSARIQAPPNLIGDAYQLILAAGIDDWGGVSPLTPDHVNPERPWPQIGELARRTEGGRDDPAGAAHRLPAVPRRALAGSPAGRHVAALADPVSGLARDGAMPRGLPWQEPDGGWGEAAGRTDLHVTIDTSRADGGPAGRLRRGLRRLGRGRGPDRPRGPPGRAARAGGRQPFGIRGRRCGGDGGRRAPAHACRGGRRAAGGRARPGRDHRRAGPGAARRGRPELEALAALADAVRRDAAGDEITYVVTRNINFTNVCYTGCRFCAFAQRRTDADAYTLSLSRSGDRAAEAWQAGATEVCMQGGIHPTCPGPPTSTSPRR